MSEKQIPHFHLIENTDIMKIPSKRRNPVKVSNALQKAVNAPKRKQHKF